jgi:hypothetical protein
MLKKLLIGIGAVVGAMAITLGILLLVQLSNAPVEDAPSADSSVFVPDLSKDYGACSVLEQASIISVLGEPANNLQPANNIGIIEEPQAGEGAQDIAADSQTCVYAFASGGAAENGFNITNAFVVQNTTYASLEGARTVIEQVKADPSTVEVSAENAFYTPITAAQGPGAVHTFELQVFNGTVRTVYSIRQPAEAVTFNAESARTALLALADQAQN